MVELFCTPPHAFFLFGASPMSLTAVELRARNLLDHEESINTKNEGRVVESSPRP
jgi:hypothetical protein